MNDGISNIIDHRLSLLSRFLEDAWGRPYQLGDWDCILFIAAWADRLMATSDGAPTSVGLDGRGCTFTVALQGRYNTEAQAIRQFARHGILHAIHEALTRRGWKERLPVDGLEPGDIVVTDLHHPGIWDGTRIVAQPARASGLLNLHASHAVLALRWPARGARAARVASC